MDTPLKTPTPDPLFAASARHMAVTKRRIAGHSEDCAANLGKNWSWASCPICGGD